jgi:hypothetical protein
LRTVSSAQAASASAIGLDKASRSRRRWSSDMPLIVSSTPWSWLMRSNASLAIGEAVAA